MISRVSAICRATCFVGVTLPLMPAQFLLIKFWPAMARRLPYHYHRLCCRILGFDIRISGKLPDAGQCLIVSNHVSWIDIVALSTIAPLSFVAKREVASWPFFGWLAKLQRTVFVDRERRHSTKHSRSEMEERLSAGDRIVLFPEGTSHDGASVLPFKSSFFAAASSADVAVVPVTLAYARHWNLPMTRRNRPRFAWYADMELIPHLWEAICAGPLTVQIVIHDALDAQTREDRKLAAVISQRVIRRSLAAALHGRLVLE